MNKSRFLIFLSILILSISGVGLAAAADATPHAGIEGVGGDYAWSQTTGTYVEITGGTQVTTSCDDTNYDAISLPFSFSFNGTAYTQVSINCNGFIAMGATVISSYTPISSGTSNNVIVPLGGDQQTNLVDSEIRYETLGTAPNQVFVIQWKNFRHYGTTGDIYNYQIRLYETSNLVEVMYGPFTQNATNRTAQVGLRGASNADFNNRKGTADWVSSSAGTINSDTMALTTAYVPVNGLTWVWTPLAPHPIFDTSSKDAPPWVLLDDSIPYNIHIRNSGNADALSATLVDPIPVGTTYNGDVTCSSGVCSFDGTNITWAGTVAIGGDETVSFSVSTAGLACATSVTNQATMDDPGLLSDPVTRSASTLLVYAPPMVEESFEISVPPDGWGEVIIFDPGTDPDWSQVSVGTTPTINPHSGGFMAKFNSYSTGNGGMALLYTMALDFSGAANPAVSFYMSHDTGYSSNADQIQLQASTDGGVTWENVGTPILRYDPTYTVAGWGFHSVDFSAYAGMSNVWVGFLGMSAYGNNFYLDDVTILASCGLTGAPQIVVDPLTYDASLLPDQTTVLPMTIRNLGGERPSVWDLRWCSLPWVVG